MTTAEGRGGGRLWSSYFYGVLQKSGYHVFLGSISLTLVPLSYRKGFNLGGCDSENYYPPKGFVKGWGGGAGENPTARVHRYKFQLHWNGDMSCFPVFLHLIKATLPWDGGEVGRQHGNISPGQPVTGLEGLASTLLTTPSSPFFPYHSSHRRAEGR